MTEGTERPAEAPAPDETFGWTESDTDGRPAGGQAREWLAQLQSMIEGLAEQAGPVIRDVGIKAAELAAIAGEKAGPVAQRAAEVTAEAGQRLAEKSRDLAAELRREAAAATAGTSRTAPDPAPVAGEPAGSGEAAPEA